MSVIAIYPAQDSYVNANLTDTPAAQFVNSAKLIAGCDFFNIDGYHGLCYPFILFDLAAIPSGSTIFSAQLVILAFYTGGNYGSVPLSVHRCADISWTEATLTWNNQPAAGSVVGSFSLESMSNQELYVDITTSEVQSALAAGKLTLRISCDDNLQSNVEYPTVGFQDYDFNSPVQAVRRPYLVVNYTAGSTRRRSTVVVA